MASESRASGSAPVIHFIGPPGCGKGTVAQYLCANMGCVSYSVGQLMRDEITMGSDLGKQLADTASGNIAGPELAMQVIGKHLHARKQPIILDGFPRNIAQAEAYIRQIGKPDLSIVINVREQTALARLTGRSRDSGRQDDAERVQKVRMQKYKDETFPVIAYLKSQACTVLEVDGEQTPDAVSQAVRGAIKEHLEI